MILNAFKESLHQSQQTRERGDKIASRVILVNVNPLRHRADPELEELAQLAYAAGIETVVQRLHFPLRKRSSAALLGTFQIDQVFACKEATQADMIIVDFELSGRQLGKLAVAWGCKVMDRTHLIIDLFARNASTREGKLQVRLAQLRHELSLLVRRWSHLERQRGGIGLRSGSGETQIESDRQMLQKRCRSLEKQIVLLKRQRWERRKNRTRQKQAQVVLVGYTNAGKSTLFNRLTGANVKVRDQLFVTLDPSVRGLPIPGLHDVLLTDTIGFVNRLPHSLITAFQATLEEVTLADLLLVVCDVTQAQSQLKTIHRVLSEIGADHVPCIEVMNKTDLCPAYQSIRDSTHNKFWISAATGEGCEEFISAIRRSLHGDYDWYCIKQCGTRLRTRLHDKKLVREERYDPHTHTWELLVHLSEQDWQALQAHTELILESVSAPESTQHPHLALSD